MTKPKVIAIVGPTASGKTSLSIKLATQYHGEVISADSRQVYRGLDLGSGKVTLEEMAGIPHHLLDIADPMDIYTAHDFARDATTALQDIISRDKLPIIAGGSFFYLDQLRGTTTNAPVPPNPNLRLQLEEKTTAELYARLQTQDLERATAMDPHNKRRLIRALEITEALGTVPPTPIADSPYDWLMLGIEISKEQLHHNIKVRIDERMQAGMLEEAKRLHAEGMTYERMHDLGLEYRFLAQLLQGTITEQEMSATLEIKTRQFAKRQLTWLKRDPTIVWINPQDNARIANVVAKFIDKV